MARCLCCWIVVLSHCSRCLGNCSWARNGMVRGMFGLGGLRLRNLRAWLIIWSARLRPGSSRLDAMRRMA